MLMSSFYSEYFLICPSLEISWLPICHGEAKDAEEAETDKTGFTGFPGAGYMVFPGRTQFGRDGRSISLRWALSEETNKLWTN